MNNIENISATGEFYDPKKSRLNENTLIAYLEGTLTQAEQQKVEEWLAAEGMESDAIDGLKELDTAQSKESTNRLNQNLNKILTKSKRKHKPIKLNQFTIIAIVVILLLIAVTYFIINKMFYK